MQSTLGDPAWARKPLIKHDSFQEKLYKKYGTLALEASYARAQDSGRKGSDSRDTGGRVLIAATQVVTAERVPMAVILIVEDEVFTREIAEMMIQDWGHDTLTASDVDEALSLLRSPQPIDALFTDIYLKTAVLGGCELARQAIELRPDLRVLYTTGNAITDKMKALFVNGKHFLLKPYTPDQLKISVGDMLAA